MKQKKFAPAKQDKVSTIIIKRIRSAILQGQYQPGESLPIESELVEQFGVSKHTVREALRALEGMGFITMKRGAGGGPIVSKIDWDTAREYFSDFLQFQNVSIQELSEIRLLLEPYIAKKAAEKSSAEMVMELEKVHEQCEELVRRNETLVGAEAEILFHVLLAKYCGNSVLWVILYFVNNILSETKRKINPGLDFSTKVIKAHRKILQAVVEKNPESAEKYMRDHVVEVEAELIDLSQKEVASRNRVAVK